MKKILVGLFFVMFAFQVNAAPVEVSDTIFLTSITEAVPFGAGTDFNLTSSGPSFLRVDWSIHDLVANSITNFGANILDSSNSIVATLMGNGAGGSVILALGSYKLAFFGTAGLNTAGANALLSASAVPVPAAVWLFGSALVGLFGASRRKSSAMAA